MHTIPILKLAAVATFTTIQASNTEKPDGYSHSDGIAEATPSAHSNPSTSRPTVDFIDESSGSSYITNRRFGTNAFVGSAVRSSQQALFKSVIEGVSLVGSAVQTKVLDTINFGYAPLDSILIDLQKCDIDLPHILITSSLQLQFRFPIEGSSYVQIKSGDSRTKTFFDSPASGFTSSNDGFGKESSPAITGSQTDGTAVFDRGGFTISFNLDTNLLNGSTTLVWTDQAFATFIIASDSYCIVHTS